MQPSPPVAAPPLPPPPGEPAAKRSLLVPAVVAGVLVLAGGFLWLVGGFEQTPQQPVKAAGQAIEQGRFTVTVQDVRMIMGKAALSTKVERFVAVRMRVVSHDRETASLMSGGLSDGLAARTKDGKWVPPDDVEGSAAGQATMVVQPGLSVDVIAKWKAGAADAPRQFTVGLREWVWKTGFTDREYRWWVDDEDDKLAGRLTLPVAGR